MATALHSVQTDTDGLHEPKGHSTALLDDYYRLNGSGSGVMKASPCSDYAQMNIVGNTTAFSLTAAIDGTLKTNTDYVRFSGTGAPWTSGFSNDIAIDTSQARLTYPKTGIYIIDIFAVIRFATTSNRVAFKTRLNGVSFSGQRFIVKGTAIDDILIVHTSRFLNITANDYLEIMIASDKTVSNFIEEAAVVTHLVRQT